MVTVSLVIGVKYAEIKAVGAWEKKKQITVIERYRQDKGLHLVEVIED